jgi:hypothetical protein
VCGHGEFRRTLADLDAAAQHRGDSKDAKFIHEV